MKTIALLCLVGCVSLCSVSAEEVATESKSEATLLDDILRQITNGLLNSRNNGANGVYEVADDGSIHFIPNESKASKPTLPPSPTPSPTTRPTTTTETPSTTASPTVEPNLEDDESVKDYSEGEDEAEGTLWEFLAHRVETQDPLGEEDGFPLVDTNEIEDDAKDVVKPSKLDVLERRRRDVNVDVGGSGHGSGGSGVVDVAVNKPGSNVNVNVGSIQDFLSAFGIHFNAKPSSHPHASGSAGGNVDVNVGGKPGSGSNVDVSVNKPNKQTNVVVDWASFIPFVNVGVNKNKPGGGSNVDVNVGQNGGGHSSGGLVDVQVNKGEGNDIAPAEARKSVVVRAPFVDVNVDGEGHPHEHEKPHKPKKHHKHHRDHEGKDVSVNVGGNGPWGPFVDVKVGNDGKSPQGKAVGRKCVKINVPFVNVLVNRNCDPDA